MSKLDDKFAAAIEEIKNCFVVAQGMAKNCFSVGEKNEVLREENKRLREEIIQLKTQVIGGSENDSIINEAIDEGQALR